MQVILIEDVEKLGSVGDLVDVKGGYGRNYLVPQSKAILASARNLKQLAHQKRIAGFHRDKALRLAADARARLAGISVKIERRVGEQGKLFGSVTSLDIERALSEQGVEIDRRKIVLQEPIKDLGTFEVQVRLHADVAAAIKIEVVAQAD